MPEKTTVGFIGGKFLPLHEGHLYAIREAAGRVDELYVILSSSEPRDRQLCMRSTMGYVSPGVRLSWIGEAVNDIPNVRIRHVEDENTDNYYDWIEGARMIRAAIGKPIDYVFSSEPEYTTIFERCYPGAAHVLIDPARSHVDVSATRVRDDVYAQWEKLPSVVRSSFVARVAIVGTESCGKSTLTRMLADAYDTSHVEEVGREYCERYSNMLTPEMFDDIAMGHYLRQGERAYRSNKLLFVDTEAVVTQYYLEMYFPGRESGLVEAIINKQAYDLVLYLEPDVVWVDDGIRFAGEERERLANNERLKAMYQERGIGLVCIDGSYEERFEKAKGCIDDLLERKRAGEPGYLIHRV